MATYQTLKGYFEDYLKREGLFNIIPEYRRESLFTLPILFIWFGVLTLSVIWTSFTYYGVKGSVVSILISISVFFLLFVALLIYFLFRQLIAKRKLEQSDASLIGGVILFPFPLLTAIVVGVYLQSWASIVWIFLASILATLLIVFLKAQTFRIYLVFELTRSIFRTIFQSLKLISLLLPILLAIILLSIFSQDLWNALGNLTTIRIIGSIILLAAPAYLLVRNSAKKVLNQIIGDFPTKSEIITRAEHVHFIKEKLDRGFISKEEWENATWQLTWRHTEKLTEILVPLRHRASRLFGLLLVITNIALVIVFFFYFFVLFELLIGEELISQWTQVRLINIGLPLRVFSYNWQINISSALVPLAKVSLLLAVFIAVITTTQSITDETFREIFTDRLKQKYDEWLTISSVYLCIDSPNYQIWDYIVNDRKLGRLNVNVVVPQGLTDEQIEKACDQLAARFENYRHWIRVTAFEQNSEKSIYRRGIPGKRWVYHHNKITEHKIFEENHFFLDELSYDHNLGKNSLKNGQEIPDEWFGDNQEAIGLARSIWEDDIDHNLILHPHVFVSNEDTIILDVNLTKRLATSLDYEDLIGDLFAQVDRQKPEVVKVMIGVFFRETPDLLTSFDLNRATDFVSFYDEIEKKSRFDTVKNWETQQRKS